MPDTSPQPVPVHFEDSVGLQRVRIVEGWAEDEYGHPRRTSTVMKDPDGDLLTSALTDEIHMPVVDLDMPAVLRPSKTQGHFHLIIDHPMTWRSYKRLLRSLVRAGLVEQEWYGLVRRRRQALITAQKGDKPCPRRGLKQHTPSPLAASSTAEPQP